MGDYRRIPEYVTATVWDEKASTLNAIGCRMSSCKGHALRPDECTSLRIETFDGAVPVNKGDYIVTFADGTLAVFTPSDFECEFEPV